MGGYEAWRVYGTMAIDGVANAVAQLSAVDTKARGVAGTAAATAATVGRLAASFAMVGLVAVAAIAVESVRAFSDFDAAMTQSLAIMGDVTAVMRNDMQDAAMAVAASTTFSATEAAESFFFLASAGLSAEASIAALPVVAQFAQAGMFDMAQATDLLTDAQSALGQTVRDDTVANLENMIELSDILVKANTLANASVEQFAQALTNRAAAAMRMFNVETEQGVAVLAALADQGMKGTQAGMSLNILLRDLTANATRNREAFDTLGISIFDTEGNISHLADIVEDFERVLSSANDEQAVMVFQALGLNQRVADVTRTLIGTSEQIREYEAALYDANGITREVAAKQLQTFRAQLTLLGSTLRNVFLIIGSHLTPVLTDLVEHALIPIAQWLGILATDFMPKFVEWTEKMRDGLIALRFEWERFGLRGWPVLSPWWQSFRAEGAANRAEAASIAAQFEHITTMIGQSDAAVEKFIHSLVDSGKLTREAVIDIGQTFMNTARGMGTLEQRQLILSQLPAELAAEYEDAELRVLVVLRRLGGNLDGLIDGIKTGFEEVPTAFDLALQALLDSLDTATTAVVDPLREASTLFGNLVAHANVLNALGRDYYTSLRAANVPLQEMALLHQAGLLSLEQEIQYLQDVLRYREEISDAMEVTGVELPPGIEGMRALPTPRKIEQAISAGWSRPIEKATKSVFDDLRPDLEREGARLIQSLARGMLTMGDVLDVAIKILARRFIMPGLLDIFGIASPSKWMMARGQDLMEGLAIGIRENSGSVQTAMENAMVSVQQAMLNGEPAFGGAGAVSGGAGRGGLVVNVPPRRTPFDFARDSEWQAALRDSLRHAEEGGFRLRGRT